MSSQGLRNPSTEAGDDKGMTTLRETLIQLLIDRTEDDN